MVRAVQHAQDFERNPGTETFRGVLLFEQVGRDCSQVVRVLYSARVATDSARRARRLVIADRHFILRNLLIPGSGSPVGRDFLFDRQ